MTEQRRVYSACHFSFVFTCSGGRRDGERCLDTEVLVCGQAERHTANEFVVGRQVEDCGSRVEGEQKC